MKTTHPTLLLLVACATLLTFCSKDDDVRPEPSPAIANGAKAGAAGAAGAAAHTCPTDLPGPPLVEVEGPDGTKYCIDATEVTQGQYEKFVDAKKDDVSGQVAECWFNKSWTPREMGFEQLDGCPKGLYDPAKKPDRPMPCVNWCQAKAYCEWAGKRLCGKVGGGTISAEKPEDAADPAGEWYNACSQRGKTRYPYGDTYDPSKCYFRGKGGGTSDGNAPAASDPLVVDCHGTEPPFDRIVNMSGSLAEWESSCAVVGMGDHICRIRGGELEDVAESTSCGSGAFTSPIYIPSPNAGIRCCAD